MQDSDVVIIDDMIDTAGTLCAAAEVLKANGGARGGGVRACARAPTLRGAASAAARTRVCSSARLRVRVARSVFGAGVAAHQGVSVSVCLCVFVCVRWRARCQRAHKLTHGHRAQESCLEEVVVVDTIPLSPSSKAVDKIIQARLPVALLRALYLLRVDRCGCSCPWRRCSRRRSAV